jgi:hypothetical protein
VIFYRALLLDRSPPARFFFPLSNKSSLKKIVRPVGSSVDRFPLFWEFTM